MSDTILRAAVTSLRPGQAAFAAGLCVLPLRATREVQAKYVLLDQAIGRGRLTVTEVSEAGSVPYLVARNLGPWPVLVFDGEELVGAKQNRIANTTILIGVGKSVLPVSCVEQGRWSHRSRTFAAGSYASHPRLRALKEEKVREASLAEARRGGVRREPAGAEAGAEEQSVRARRFRSDQGEVWREVSDAVYALAAEAPTMALADGYRAAERRMDKVLTALGPDVVLQTRDVVGVAVFWRGGLVCLDLLQPARRFAQLYPKLLRGYAFEASLDDRWGQDEVSVDGFDPEAAALRLLADLRDAKVEEQPSVDLGTDLRLTGGSVSGAGLAWNDELIQLSVFPRKR